MSTKPKSNPTRNSPVDDMRAQTAAESRRIAGIRKLCAENHPDIEASACLSVGIEEQRGSIRWCHYVGNCFAAYRDVLQAIRWDESLKVEEHWDFFWR